MLGKYSALLLAALIWFGVARECIGDNQPGAAIRTAGKITAPADVSGQTDSMNLFEPPILGYALDVAQGRFRYIAGIPGAAGIGPLISSPMLFQKAWIAPGEDFALAEPAGVASSCLFLCHFQSVSLSVEKMPLFCQSPDLVVFSPRGGSAALYLAATQKAVKITGLPLAPKISSPVDLSMFPMELTSLAVSEDGEILLFGFSDNATGVVYSTSSASVFRQAAVAGHATALAFIGAGNNALLADRSRSQIVLLENITGSVLALPLAGEAEGVIHPTAIQTLPNSSLAVITSRESTHLCVLNWEDRTLQQWPLSIKASALQPLRGTQMLQLTNFAGGPLWMLDHSSQEPRLLLIPFVGESERSNRSATRVNPGEKRQR
jgi:hypothetical protein